ncbi:calcium-binding protein, putative [Hepatocystis sp. ex Piliocolobus tephrosceles]|nr:calcium-binding protein, putative [Hepatocystis sp. ex Piliocolobus tephrosceles]
MERTNESTNKPKEEKYKYLKTDEINNLEFMFNKIIKNKNTNLSIQVLEKYLIRNHNKEICEDLLCFFDYYGSTITFDDFLEYLNCDINNFKSKEKIKGLFELIDTNKKGFITSKDFIHAAKEFENEFNEETLKDIFNMMDMNNDDIMRIEEFKNAIANN